jgi:hypothetical protein
MNIAHENTKRTLSEEPLFATRQWLCRFNVHTWLVWNDPVKSKRGTYDYVEQFRKCGCCGKVQRTILSKD